jgi:uncharacterized membrane protein YfcA
MLLGFIAILFTGFVLGLLGGGGSILTVPILVYIFKIHPAIATAYSLFIVGTAASFGAYRNFKAQTLDVKTGLSFAFPGLIGVFCSRTLIVPNLPEVVLSTPLFQLEKGAFIMVVFATMMILASYSMIMGRSEGHAQKQNLITRSLLGFLVGIATGFVGAGGGFILIPVLIKFAGLPMKKAVGTSLFIISINSLIGFTGDIFVSTIDWGFIFKLAVLAVLGILLGTSMSKKVPGKILKKIFGFFVLILGSWIIYSQV